VNSERAFSLTAACLLLTACDKPAPGTVAVTWVVSADPRVTISTENVPVGQELSGILSARRLADGRILVANSGTSALLLFDDHGAFVRAIGRKGEGPGEFSGSIHMFRARGDSLAVFDGGNLRWTFYDSALTLGRTALAAGSGIARPTWLHNGAVMTNASLDDPPGWAGAVIDGLRARDPGFDSLVEGRIDDLGAIWIRNGNRWVVHSPDRELPGEVDLPVGFRVLQAGVDFVLGVEKDSVDQDMLRILRLERAGAPLSRVVTTAITSGPSADTALVLAISTELLTKQEMYYANRAAYAPHADSLPGVLGRDVKTFILWGDARHWAAVTVRKATGATCGVSVGWPAPAGWLDGTPFCGRE